MTITETDYKWSGALDARSSTKYIILHHRGGNGDVQSIHSQHLSSGWLGIGYHFYIRKNGRVYRGRPIGTVGAHCTGYNSSSVGICFEGNLETDEVMPYSQLKAGRELLLYLKKLYPEAAVKRHCDFASTACPGKNFPFVKIQENKTELISANDITWELSQMIEINDVDGFVRALDRAKTENSPLYWGLRKIVNR